jgi:hypothetical protein
MWQIVSAAVVLLVPVLALVYDLAAGLLGGRQATLSAAVGRMAAAWPELPAVVGGLFVWLWLHLFLSVVLARGEH